MEHAEVIVRRDAYINDALVQSVLTRTEESLIRHQPQTKAEFYQMMSRSLRMDRNQSKLVLALLETSGKVACTGRGHSSLQILAGRTSPLSSTEGGEI